MSFSEDIREARSRFPQHVTAVEELFKRHDVHSVSSAWSALARAEFRTDATKTLESVMRVEGGKLSLGLVFAIVGAALGGVGIAAMGGAVGVPLALVGAIVGLVIGNEADTEGYTSTLMRKFKAFWDA